jgi:hypothetical protein
MRFIKVHPDLAIDADKIEALKVTGREDNCNVTAFMESREFYHLSRHKSFRDAEISMMDLIERLESE